MSAQHNSKSEQLGTTRSHFTGIHECIRTVYNDTFYSAQQTDTTEQEYTAIMFLVTAEQTPFLCILHVYPQKTV